MLSKSGTCTVHATCLLTWGVSSILNCREIHSHVSVHPYICIFYFLIWELAPLASQPRYFGWWGQQTLPNVHTESLIVGAWDSLSSSKGDPANSPPASLKTCRFRELRLCNINGKKGTLSLSHSHWNSVCCIREQNMKTIQSTPQSTFVPWVFFTFKLWSHQWYSEEKKSQVNLNELREGKSVFWNPGTWLVRLRIFHHYNSFCIVL